MPKVVSILAAALVSIAGFTTHCRADAQELPAKLKPIVTCSAVAAGAATNHIPLSGFDKALGTNLLHAGDSVTILGTMFLKKKEAQWLLYIEAQQPGTNTTNEPPMVIHMFDRKIPFPSKPVPATLRLLGPFAAVGDPKQFKSHEETAQFKLNESFLGVGLDRAAAVYWHQKQLEDATNASHRTAALSGKKHEAKLTPDEQQAVAGAAPTIISYLEIVKHTEGLEDLLTKLIKLPSVWSIVRHLGVTAVFYVEGTATPANPADWDLPPGTPVYYLPCMFRLNDQPALKVTLVVTSPNPPRLICGGVVGLLAEKIGDDETYMTLRVVSARCKD